MGSTSHSLGRPTLTILFSLLPDISLESIAVNAFQCAGAFA